MPGEQLDMSKEELERLSEALKKEEFRKLLMDYAEELQDPATRKLYEEELTMLESQRGVDMKFIKPEPGFVLKILDDQNNKVFVNICTSPHVGVPEFKYAEQAQEGGKVERGQQCSLPYSLSPVHPEKDNKDVECQVYDVVYHPETLSRCSNPQFKELVVNTALDGVISNFKVKLKRDEVKYPKMKFKGTPAECVIRKRVEEEKPGTFDHLPSRPQFPDLAGEENPEEKDSAAKKKEDPKKSTKSDDLKKKPADEPEYKIIFRDNMDMANFTNDSRVASGVVPSQTLVKISLPLHASARDVDLDVYPDSLELHSKHYNLNLKLPYSVDSDNGKAKFDKDQRELSVTLDVIPKEIKQELDSAQSPSLVQELPEPNSTFDEDECIPSQPTPSNTSFPEPHSSSTCEERVTCDNPERVSQSTIETTIDTTIETTIKCGTADDVIAGSRTPDDIIAESIAECMADVSDTTSSDLSEPSIIDIPTSDLTSSDSTNFGENDSVPDEIESVPDGNESMSDNYSLIHEDVAVPDKGAEYNATTSNIENNNTASENENLSNEGLSVESPQSNKTPSIKPITILKPSDITIKLNNDVSDSVDPSSPTSRSRFNISPVPCNENTCFSADPITCEGHASCGGSERIAPTNEKQEDVYSDLNSGLSSYTDSSLEDNLNVSVRVYQDMSTATVILDSVYNSVPEVTISGKKVWLKNEDVSLYLIVPHTITTHTISMNLDNVCLVLYKQHNSLWPSIHVGHYEEEVYSFKFITEENADNIVECFGDPWVDIAPVHVTPNMKSSDSETLISYTVNKQPDALTIFPDDEDDEGLIKGILKSPHSPPPQSPRSRKVSFNEEVETFVLPSKRSIKGKKRRKKNASNSGSSASESSDEGATPPSSVSPLQQRAALEAASLSHGNRSSEGNSCEGKDGNATEGLILESAENGWSTVTHKKKNKVKKNVAATSPPTDSESSHVLQTQEEVVKMMDPSGKLSHKMLLGNSHIYDLED